MNYTTYWSILDTPSKTWQSNYVALIIFVVATALWFLAKKFKKDSGEGDRIIILWATGVFSVLGGICFIALTFFFRDTDYEWTVNMLNSPSTSKIEGVVTDFERSYENKRYATVITESFWVGDLKFSYSDALMGAFNGFTETNNRVIFDGQKVRITYRRGYNGDCEILKLEIAV